MVIAMAEATKIEYASAAAVFESMYQNAGELAKGRVAVPSATVPNRYMLKATM